MIHVACCGCCHAFEVADTRSGAEAMCPACGLRVPVPELVGAHAEGGAQSYGGTAGGATDAGSWSSDNAPPADEWDAGTCAWDDGARGFEPQVEDHQRRTRMFRTGLALTIAFMAPIAGMPGHPLMFPQFSQFPGMSLAGLVVLLPLIAGIAVMMVSRRAEPPLRGFVILAAGLALFGLMLFDRSVRSMIGESVSAMPTSINLSNALLSFGAFGLIVATRVRLYRPLSRVAHLLGVIAAGCYLVYLFVPTNGSMPIAAGFSLFKFQKMLGLAMIAHVGLMVTASVLCLMNTRSTRSTAAVARAGRASWFLVGALVVPVVAITLMALSMSAGGAVPFISTAAKFGVMYGGLLLLVPIGTADLLIGRA